MPGKNGLNLGPVLLLYLRESVCAVSIQIKSKIFS